MVAADGSFILTALNGVVSSGYAELDEVVVVGCVDRPGRLDSRGTVSERVAADERYRCSDMASVLERALSW